MISVCFNIWADDYIKKFKYANKIVREQMIAELQMDINYIKSDLDSLQKVLDELK